MLSIRDRACLDTKDQVLKLYCSESTLFCYHVSSFLLFMFANGGDPAAVATSQREYDDDLVK